MTWCFYILFGKFHRSIITQTLLMQEAIQKRKHQQWIHIEQTYKNYKKTFNGRPLIPKQIITYLQMTNFIMQLVPAFNEHYFSAMTQEENSFVNQVMQTVSSDMLNKLKSLAYRIQKKEIQENNGKDVKTLCKVCLHELRAAQIAEAKHSLQGKQALTQSILKMIKEVEETSQTFSFQEDRRFFKELKNALKKKEEIIQICQSEGTQFINMIEEQLKGIMLNRQSLIFPEDRASNEPQMKGYELKQNVKKSLKNQINEKIPEIVRIVSENLRKKQQRQRKMRTMHTSVQTMDAQTPKILDFKRKISSLQQELTQANNQKTKLSWSLQQKTLGIDRYQRQLKDLRQELNIKVYDLQKQVRSLQEKNKKYKEQMEKFKSRRNIDMNESNLKSMNSFAQLKDPSFAQQTPEEPQQHYQRKQKKKKTVLSLSKTNGKFYLPTIKKISNDDEGSPQQDTLKHGSQQQQQNLAQNIRQNRFNSNDVTMISSAKISISRQNSKEYIESKQKSRSRKKGERMLTIADTKDSINEGEMMKKASYKSIKTERGAENFNYNQQISQKEKFPSIKKEKDQNANLKKKSSNQIKRINNLSNPIKQKNGKIIKNHFQENQNSTQVKVSQRNIMKQQAYEINEQLKSKISRKSSANSSLQNKPIYNSTSKPTKQSIYKEKIRIQGSASISQSFYQNCESQDLPNKRHTQKPYLRNSFSKINEEIDKQNYQTPQYQPESVGVEDLKKIQENKSIKHHLFKIYRELSKETRLNKEISIEKFSQIFERYVSQLKTNKNDSKQAQNDDNLVMAMTEPILPKINQNLLNASLLNTKQNENYSSMSRLKKYNQRSELQLLKSRLQQQVSRGKSKENSFNASYQLSPTMTQEQYQLSRFGRQQPLTKNRNTTLMAFESLLFFNEEIAYNYETNFSKRRAKKASVPLTPQIEEYLGQLFNVFEEIKGKNLELYHSISGFLRYPFSHSQNGFLQIDIIKTLSLNALTQCFLRLLTYHKSCECSKSVCPHLLDFKKKLQGFASVKKA